MSADQAIGVAPSISTPSKMSSRFAGREIGTPPTPPSPTLPSPALSAGPTSKIFSVALPDWKATHKTKTILPANSNIPAKARTTPSPSFLMRPAASPPSSTMPRRQSIAPKRRACVKNWLKSKTNPNRLPAFLFPNVFSARVPVCGFVLPRCCGSNRYLTTLDKCIARTLDQLERLQQIRKGQPVPPPLNVNVTT